jgi:hypothetical protein
LPPNLPRSQIRLAGDPALAAQSYYRPEKELQEMSSKAGTKKARTAQPPTPIDSAKPPVSATKSVNAVGIPQDAIDQVRRRAYELYEQRGCQHGFHEQDWIQAETEILSRSRASRTA